MNRFRSTPIFAAVLILLGLCAAAHAADVPTRGPVVNIVEWDGGALPPVYERSDQLPLTREDILNLSRNDFTPEGIVRMVEERRFVGDASPGALIQLKKAGITPEVIQAVSRHALPPNRALTLSIHLEFEGTSAEARRRYLYVVIPDGPYERTFTADIGAVLARRWQRDIVVDQTDPLLPKQVRHVTFSGSVPLKTYGQKEVLVFASTKPDVYTSADIPRADRAGVRKYLMDYPASSLLQDCRLRVRFRQDSVLPYKWQMVGSHLECEWN